MSVFYRFFSQMGCSSFPHLLRYIFFTFNQILVIWCVFSVLNAVGNTLAYIPIYILLTSTVWIEIGREVKGIRWREKEWDRMDGQRGGEKVRDRVALTGWKKKEWGPSDYSCFLLFMSYKKQWRGRRRRDCSFRSFPWVEPSIGPCASSVSNPYLSLSFIFAPGIQL